MSEIFNKVSVKNEMSNVNNTEDVYVMVSYPFVSTHPIKLSELQNYPLGGYANLSRIDNNVSVNYQFVSTYPIKFSECKTTY